MSSGIIGGGGGGSDFGVGVPSTFTKQAASGEAFLIQKGQLNKLRLRPQIMNEHAESSRNVQGVVSSGNIVGQVFRASQDNINGLNLTLESAAGVVFDDFESYENDAALQTAWEEGTNLATLETSILPPDGDTQAMKMPTTTLGDEWVKTVPPTDYTGFNGKMIFRQSSEYSKLKMRFFIGDGTNTKSAPVIAPGKDTWFDYQVTEGALTEDGGGTTNAVAITKVGFRVEAKEVGQFAYVDNMVAVPPPGEVEVKLWNMGATLPTSGAVSLNNGTQYTKLGDLGITGVQASSVTVDLIGGKRMYHINNFVAGVALEIPANEPLTKDDYYAVTIHHVDTVVNVYGPNEAWDNYYENGYAFTAPDEATNIAAVGADADLMFIVFSTQDAYLFEVTVLADDVPNGNTKTTFYIEDENMRRTDVLVSGIKAVQAITTQLPRPFFVVKGSKMEQEYNDDFTDPVSSINLITSYYFIPPTVHG